MAVLKNPKHERFAQEYAKLGNGKQAYIAAGYSANGAEASASALLRNPNVSSRITELKQRFSEGVVKLEITKRSARVQALNDRWNRLRKVIEARAVDPSMEGIPGGDTGLIVRQFNKFGDAEYSVDTGTLKEIRAHEQQAAQELGQWTEKRVVTGEDGGPIKIDLTGVATDDLRTLQRIALAALGSVSDQS